jgi:pimeloyl-ACP methyl ester carboxylesterase
MAIERNVYQGNRILMPTAAFRAAYDAVLAQWPVQVEAVDVPSPFGATHVNICGPTKGQPLVLLPGGGATSTVWFANIQALTRAHRVYALDIPGDAGLSVSAGRSLRGSADLTAWLDSVFRHFELTDADLCGHSYGAAIALNYAAGSERVRRLVLLDPTNCFAGMKPNYLLHAAGPLVRPTPVRSRAFLRWETGGLPLDPTWLDLAATAAPEFPVRGVAKPGRAQLDQVRSPTLLLLAENSRAHDIHRVAAKARRSLPHSESQVLDGMTHHSMPMHDASRLNTAMTTFLGEPDRTERV